jgi:hypothetical protein
VDGTKLFGSNNKYCSDCLTTVKRGKTHYCHGVGRSLRYVKFAMKDNYKNRTQILIVTTCLKMPLFTLYKMIKARWDIENCIFNNPNNEASLYHCFVHGGNSIEAIMYLMFIASNLFQLFKLRRIKNHVEIQKELVRLLLKGLCLLKYSNKLILDTT